MKQTRTKCDFCEGRLIDIPDDMYPTEYIDVRLIKSDGMDGNVCSPCFYKALETVLKAKKVEGVNGS